MLCEPGCFQACTNIYLHLDNNGTTIVCTYVWQ